MDAQWLLWLYHNYALVLGVTSHRWVSGGGLRQTWLTRSYALILNIVELLTLPYVLWFIARCMNRVQWFPNHIPNATYVFYSVCYLTIAYTIISRDSQQKALLEVDSIVGRLKRLKSRENRLPSTCGSLSHVFYLKMGAVIYMFVYGMTSCLLLLKEEESWLLVLHVFVFGSAMNIPIVATYRYFLALWDIANCYQYINGKLEHLMKSVRKRYPTQVELKELHRLWSLHALLGRCTLKMSRVYGLLLLTARFYNLAFSVINFYWGILLVFSAKAPVAILLYGTAFFYVRILDFFLLNFICDLTTQYQNYAHHLVSEGYWFKELNAYLLYANTSKMNLWVCGLYKVNRKCWYQMLLSILNFSLLMLQFHLVVKNKFTLKN